MLVLKCTLVPLCIMAATLASRRWGPRIGGCLAGMPFVIVSILLVLALERGQRFAADTALGSIYGLTAYVAYGATYCWTVGRLGWRTASIAATLAWAAAAFVLSQLPGPLLVHVLVAAAGLGVAPWILPAERAAAPDAAGPKGNVLLRMSAGAGLTIFVSELAHVVGESWAGLFSAFPVLGSITLVGAYRWAGPAEAARLFRGMVSGAWSTLVCESLLVILLPKLPLAPAFLLASVAAACVAVASLLLTRDSRRVGAERSRSFLASKRRLGARS